MPGVLPVAIPFKAIRHSPSDRRPSQLAASSVESERSRGWNFGLRC